MSTQEKAIMQLEPDKSDFINANLIFYEKYLGLNGPLALSYDRLIQKKAGTQALQDTYLPLADLAVSLEDVLRLEADLTFGGEWGPKSRDILDGLLRIRRRQIASETRQGPNIASSDRLTLKELEDYFSAKPENDSLPSYIGDNALDYIVERAISDYRDNFILPQRIWMPDIPPLFDRTNPVQVIDNIRQQVDTGAYPNDHPSEIHKERNLFGESSISLPDIGTIIYKGHVVARLTDWSLTVEANGLLNEAAPVDVPYNVIDEGMAEIGNYLTEVANGRERSPRDCYHVANFGTFALLRGRIGDGNPVDFFLTANKAFSLARTLADVYLQDNELRSFINSLQAKQAESSLRIGLAQLYDKARASETETYLIRALENQEALLNRDSHDQRVQSMRLWTLYHLGCFYQDVLNDNIKAQGYIEKAIEQISPTSGLEIAEKAEQRLDKAREIVTLTTAEGNRVISFAEHIKALSQLEASMQKGVVEHFGQIGLQYITVPELVGVTGACENVDTLFKVLNRAGVQLFITQTGQLALEQALQVHRNGVYTIIHSGRDEEIEDNRHLRQFRLTEEEFGLTMVDGMTRDNYDEGKMFEALLQHIEASTKTMIRAAVEQHGDTLLKLYGRDLKQLRETIENPYYRITYEDAIILLRENGFSNLKFGDDLKAEHEQAVIKLLNHKKQEESGEKVVKSDLPVIIMRYPKEIKFFNMKVSEIDPRVVLSADLILPIAGEVAGASVREHRGKQLEDRLLSSEMFRIYCERTKLPPETAIDDFRWYLDIINKGKTDPHAGYGIGNERIMQFILGLDDIRKCSGMWQLAKETGDWEKKEAIPLPAT